MRVRPARQVPQSTREVAEREARLRELLRGEAFGNRGSWRFAEAVVEEVPPRALTPGAGRGTGPLR
ncbi:hypothetical protein MTP02_36830 [Streptomyces albus]|nr:hypothetical protein MTP02_36830 [Streptomyces albus]